MAATPGWLSSGQGRFIGSRDVSSAGEWCFILALRHSVSPITLPCSSNALTLYRTTASPTLTLNHDGPNEQRISAIRIGQYYIQLGNYEQALHWLEITPDKPNFLAPFMNVDPIYDPVRSDPRFQSLLERMNLRQSK